MPHNFSPLRIAGANIRCDLYRGHTVPIVRRNGDDFVWKVEDQGIELAVPYLMRSGAAILDVSHQTPPDSIRE